MNIEPYITAVAGISILVVLWIIVQGWWRHSFADFIDDEDVLAERRSCGQCGCTNICEKRKRNPSK